MSRSAIIVCQGRAAAHGRIAPGRFSDPVAELLLRPDEMVPVLQVRDGTPPKGWRDRFVYEMARGSAEILVPRTVAIDDAIRAGETEQVVILGAGLDARAWRMSELAGSAVFEVDLPATQRDKRERAAGLGGRQPVYVPVEFGRDDLRAALTASGHRAEAATTWVWEGVIPYLTRDEVRATAADVVALSGPGSRVIVNYQADSPAGKAAVISIRIFTAIARNGSPWRTEPWRSLWTPQRIAAAFPGFTVIGDSDLLAVAESLGVVPRDRRSLVNSRLMVASN